MKKISDQLAVVVLFWNDSVSISIESSCKWTNDIVLVDNFNEQWIFKKNFRI